MILDRYPGIPPSSDPYWDQPTNGDFQRLRGLRGLGYWTDGQSVRLPEEFVRHALGVLPSRGAIL
jgi:hypothetical protein